MVDGRNGIGIRPYACLHKVRARATVQYHVLTVRHLHTSFTFFFTFCSRCCCRVYFWERIDLGGIRADRSRVPPSRALCVRPRNDADFISCVTRILGGDPGAHNREKHVDACLVEMPWRVCAG